LLFDLRLYRWPFDQRTTRRVRYGKVTFASHRSLVDPWLSVSSGGWNFYRRLEWQIGKPVIGELRVTPSREVPPNGLRPKDCESLPELRVLLDDVPPSSWITPFGQPICHPSEHGAADVWARRGRLLTRTALG